MLVLNEHHINIFKVWYIKIPLIIINAINNITPDFLVIKGKTYIPEPNAD